MHLLVTRPQPDGGELASQLEKAGHSVSYFPLLEINLHTGVQFPEILPQAIFVTSANGARALGNHKNASQFLDTLVVTVGEASHQAAEQAGFNNITTTKRGDVVGLIDYARHSLSPNDGSVLYASGEKTSGNLVDELQQSNFQVDRVVLYDARPVDRLPETICQSMQKGDLDGVLLFSPRTAKVWLALTKGCNCTDELAKLTHYCLSKNVAKIIDQGLGKFSDIIVCERPDTPSMLHAVGRP